jgi:hypothetical protein
MVNYFKSFILLSLILLVSCQEGGDAGDLLGQWRMTDSDTKYICFSGSVTLFRCVPNGQVYGNFQHVGDSLFIQCVSTKDMKSDKAFVEKTFGFRPFDDIRLKIELLNDSHLALSKDGKTWRFYKY